MNWYTIALMFIGIDIITGLYKGIATSSLSSKIMRQGLIHKMGLVLLMVIGWAIDFAQGYVDIGYTVPVEKAVCGYIIGMEIVSALENIQRGNPTLLPDTIKNLFANSKNDGR